MVELVQQHPSGGYILDELHVGMAAEKLVVATEGRIQLFAEASDDFNPVHLDEGFASKIRREFERLRMEDPELAPNEAAVRALQRVTEGAK